MNKKIEELNSKINEMKKGSRNIETKNKLVENDVNKKKKENEKDKKDKDKDKEKDKEDKISFM